jgi:uncharacterized membrane protein YphA (DoxX/SURF4 family)
MFTLRSIDYVILGKYMILMLFIIAGALNMVPRRAQDHIDRIAAFGLPWPAQVFWGGMLMQAAGCLMLIVQWNARWGICLLIAFTVLAGGIFHRFWLVQDPQRRQMLRIGLLNNCAVVGGLVLLLGQTP